METYHVQELSIASSAGLQTTFNIPMEYKNVKALFLTYPFASTNDIRMEVKFNGVEVINKLFDPNLIRFNGYLNRRELSIRLDQIGQNCKVDVQFIVKTCNSYPLNINMYFLVE
jgi:hypothetical protein